MPEYFYFALGASKLLCSRGESKAAVIPQVDEAGSRVLCILALVMAKYLVTRDRLCPLAQKLKSPYSGGF